MALRGCSFPGKSRPGLPRKSSWARTTPSGRAIFRPLPLRGSSRPRRLPPPGRFFLCTRAAPAIRLSARNALVRAGDPTPPSIPPRLSYQNTERRRVQPAIHRRETRAAAIAATHDRECLQCPLQFSVMTAGSALAPASPGAPQKFLPASSLPSCPVSTESLSHQVPQCPRTKPDSSMKRCSPLHTKTSAPRTRPIADRRASVAGRPLARHSPASRYGFPRPAHCIWRLPALPRNVALRATRPPPTTDLPHRVRSKPRPQAAHTRSLPTAQQRQLTAESFLFPRCSLSHFPCFGVRY